MRLGRRPEASVIIGLGVLIPAILAGLRDVSIGTDTKYYVTDIFELTVSSHKDALGIYSAFDGTYDFGYVALAQIGRIIPDIHAFLFATSAATLGVAALALILFDSRHVAFPFLIFLLTYFNASLNTARQSIALSFALLAAAALVRRKPVFAILAIALAFVFHRTAAVVLIFLPLYWISESWKGSDDHRQPLPLQRVLLMLVVLGSLVLLVSQFTELAGPALDKLGLDQSYGAYLETYRNGVPLAVLLGQLSYLAFAFIWRRRYPGGRFMALGLASGTILVFLTQISVYLYRVSDYFLVLVVLASGGISGLDEGGSKGRRLLQWGLLTVAALLWFQRIIVWNNHETFPYTSLILGLR